MRETAFALRFTRNETICAIEKMSKENKKVLTNKRWCDIIIA